jgi:ParB-like chromosome segregation protein Spo0J
MLDFGHGEREVCVAMGWSATTLGAHLRLLTSSAPVKAAVAAGKLSVTAAGKLASLPTTEQREKLAELQATGKKATVERVERAVAGKKIESEMPKKKLLKELLQEVTDHDGKEARAFALGAAWSRGLLTKEELRQESRDLAELV